LVIKLHTNIVYDSLIMNSRLGGQVAAWVESVRSECVEGR